MDHVQFKVRIPVIACPTLTVMTLLRPAVSVSRISYALTFPERCLRLFQMLWPPLLTPFEYSAPEEMIASANKAGTMAILLVSRKSAAGKSSQSSVKFSSFQRITFFNAFALLKSRSTTFYVFSHKYFLVSFSSHELMMFPVA